MAKHDYLQKISMRGSTGWLGENGKEPQKEMKAKKRKRENPFT